jgi:hypothetical protein
MLLLQVKMRWQNDATISSSTSPAENDSPSFFFHCDMPPSVMVGDIAGISRFVIARHGRLQCMPTEGQFENLAGRWKTTCIVCIRVPGKQQVSS